MNSKDIQEKVYNFCIEKGLDTPYGVLLSDGASKSGKKFLRVTFCRPRTLDATVEIYNRNFIVLKTSRGYNQLFRNLDELMIELEKL